jgi:hypothetical protein
MATFEVSLDYRVDASKAMRNVENLRSNMLNLNAALDIFARGWRVIGRVSDAVLAPMININKSLEISKIKIAGVAQATSTWTGGMNRALKEADVLVEAFTKDAAASVATTSDFVMVAEGIAPVLLPIGKTFKQIRSITGDIVNAATAMGEPMQVVAEQVGRIMSGAAGRDLVAFRKLFGEELAINPDFTKDFNAMTSEDRLSSVNKKLEAWGRVGGAVENSFMGISSTLEDIFELTMRNVGLPLFKALTAELATWRDWLAKNEHLLKQMASEWGERLVTAFMAIRETIAWIIDNKDTLLLIGGAFVAARAGGALAGAAGSIPGANFGVAGGAVGPMTPGAAAASRLTSNLGMAVRIIGITAVAAKVFTDSILGKQEDKMDRAEFASDIGGIVSRFNAGTLSPAAMLEQLKAAGMDKGAVKTFSSTGAMRGKLEAAFKSWSPEAMMELPGHMSDLMLGFKEAGLNWEQTNALIDGMNTGLSMTGEFIIPGAKAAEEMVEAMAKPKTAAELLAARITIMTTALETAGLGGILEGGGGIDMSKFGGAGTKLGKEKEAYDKLKKKTKNKIEVTIIQDFKANIDPDQVRVSTMRALEDLAVNPLHPTTRLAPK